MERILRDWDLERLSGTVIYGCLEHSWEQQRIWLSCRDFKDHCKCGTHIGSNDEVMAKA